MRRTPDVGAYDPAEKALGLLERWPGWRRAEAETLLRRLGGGAAGERTARDEVLTPREAEVAALVAEGLSNGEIGRRLYISPKTASVHVSNILAKLGMSSRAEIAAWVADRRSSSPRSTYQTELTDKS
jgi:DNA-binding CsgD family transcriptional regulator